MEEKEFQQGQVTLDSTENNPKKEKPTKSIAREILEWVLTILAAVVLAFAIHTAVFELVRVDGHSMDTTLGDGEIMLVTKWDYSSLFLPFTQGAAENATPLFGNPNRFDVVICHYPGRGSTQFVKRVVGLPGDTVEIKEGYLYVNDEKYDEPYIVNRPDYTMSKYTVPEGRYFVLGDNRSNSNDSHIIGSLERKMILGRVRHIVFPFGQWRAVE